MKTTGWLLLAFAFLGGTASAATDAAPRDWRQHVTLTLSDRLRGEFVDWFRPRSGAAPEGAERYDFLGNQFRLGARVKLPHVLFAVEMQDTRLVNLPDDASPPASTVGNLGPGALYFAHSHDREQGEPFLKQGNVTLSDLPRAPGLSLTAGRFEHSDGLETLPEDASLVWLKRARIGERLIGPFGYTHVTRSFDGVRAAYDQPHWNLTALTARPTHGGFEVSANREIEDVGIAGLALTLKGIPGAPPSDLRLFYLYYEDDRDRAVKVDNRPLAARQADRGDIAVHTGGGHAVIVADVEPGRIEGLLWGALQGGDWGDLNHSAWAFAVEGGYQLPSVPGAPWLRAGYDRSSGDDDPGDGDHRTFFQILPTARIYAQLPFYNLMNSEDLFAQLILKPHPKVTLRSDYHWLRLGERGDLWYSGGGATNDTVFGFAGAPSGGRTELAHLVDVGINLSLLQQLTAYAYYGRAFGQSVVKTSFAGAAANYGYVELAFRY